MEHIYALYYEYADERRYFYVGRTNDPKRRLQEHRRNVKNTKHTEDVYQFIRERCQPNGIDVWDLEVMVTEPNMRAEDCEDFWVVLMIRAGHDLKNMKHGDLHRVALQFLARQRQDLDFTNVSEFIEFRETVEREQREAYERSERLKKSVLGEDLGDPTLLAMIRSNTERYREQNADRHRKTLLKEQRAQQAAREKEAWLKSLRIGKSED